MPLFLRVNLRQNGSLLLNFVYMIFLCRIFYFAQFYGWKNYKKLDSLEKYRCIYFNYNEFIKIKERQHFNKCMVWVGQYLPHFIIFFVRLHSTFYTFHFIQDIKETFYIQVSFMLILTIELPLFSLKEWFNWDKALFRLKIKTTGKR